MPSIGEELEVSQFMIGIDSVASWKAPTELLFWLLTLIKVIGIASFPAASCYCMLRELFSVQQREAGKWPWGRGEHIGMVSLGLRSTVEDGPVKLLIIIVNV